MYFGSKRTFQINVKCVFCRCYNSVEEVYIII